MHKTYLAKLALSGVRTGVRNNSLILYLTSLLISSTVLAATSQTPNPSDSTTVGGSRLVNDIIRETEYRLHWHSEIPYASGGAWHAANQQQGLQTYITADGILVLPRAFHSKADNDLSVSLTEPSISAALGETQTKSANHGETPDWYWGLSLIAIDQVSESSQFVLTETVIDENRIEFRRGPVSEWYVNDSRGLEQGFTLEQPLAKTNPTAANAEVTVRMAVKGSLRGEMDASGQTIHFFTTNEERVLDYSKLIAYDARGKRLPSQFLLHDQQNGQLLDLVVDVSRAVYPITIDPLASSPVWARQPNIEEVRFGISVAGAGDVNGDGYDDIIIGGDLFSGGQFHEGRAWVYHGRPNGPTNPAADWSVQSNRAGASYGGSVAGAGDVNGDGYDDVIVGADGYSNGQQLEGRVFVYHGGPSGLSTAAAWTAESNQAWSFFGRSVAGVGDANGDGYDDILIGAPRYDNGETDEGAVFLYLGGPNGLATSPSWIADIDIEDSDFGESVAGAGDVNGDGYDDAIIGVFRYDNLGSDGGRAYVFHGGPNGYSFPAAWTDGLLNSHANFGRAVSGAGDVNDDGYDDILVGAPGFTGGQFGEGKAFLYLGGPTGVQSSPSWSFEADQRNAYLGGAVSAAGDINADGFDDVIIGAESYDNGETEGGRAFVFLGSDNGLNPEPAWYQFANKNFASFGGAIDGAGDTNGDNRDDVVIGARGFTSGQSDEGKAYLFLGEIADADGDGLSDAREARGCMDPLDADTDDDGLADGIEDSNGNATVDPGETDPCSADSDEDGVQDGTESGQASAVPDPDGTGSATGTDLAVFIPDADAGTTTTNPIEADTDGDGSIDGKEDLNGNGTVDDGESDPDDINSVPTVAPVAIPALPVLAAIMLSFLLSWIHYRQHNGT